MAFFLLIVAIFNTWFILRSYTRAFSVNKNITSSEDKQVNASGKSYRYKLLQYAVLVMAVFDFPWVWLCMIQCWNNMMANNSFNQNTGNDSFACKFMGFYFGFSHAAMMGSNCLVAYYLLELKKREITSNTTDRNFLVSTRGLLLLAGTVLVSAALFGAMPLMQGDGYTLSTFGFCYADFSNPEQSSIVLAVVVMFLTISSFLWFKIGLRGYCLYYGVFFVTWSFWIPATSYGMARGVEIPSPYMLIGGIVSHSNAVINAILYGVWLFRQVDDEEISGETSDDAEKLHDSTKLEEGNYVVG